jgi:hypothetical protein
MGKEIINPGAQNGPAADRWGKWFFNPFNHRPKRSAFLAKPFFAGW